jgi:hypothetical protein
MAGNREVRQVRGAEPAVNRSAVAIGCRRELMGGADARRPRIGSYAGDALSLAAGEVESDVDDHVFLAADKAAAADLDEDVAGVQAERLGGAFGVAEEAGADAGVTEGESLAVDLDRPVLQRPDEIVGGVLQGEQVAAVLPPGDVRDSDQRFDRAVAGAGAHSRQRRVDARDAVLDRDHRVGDGQRQVLQGNDQLVQRQLSYAVPSCRAACITVEWITKYRSSIS